MRAGLKDLKDVVGEYELLMVQCYRDSWPVNRVRAGYDPAPTTPIKNLYVVGDGAKGDEIEVEGIALGVGDVVSRVMVK
ncbi:hypothetical protein DRN72_04080 [Methanosarcinales archaeon]|nr:MAG: hypothetical protein DRN72_04080 [Methanosarcinales archaeon]